MPDRNIVNPSTAELQALLRSHWRYDTFRPQQEAIIRLLIEHGARLTDTDHRGKSVSASVTSTWVKELLRRDGHDVQRQRS